MFKFLETFMVVYRTHSFSLAAQQLFITQPTVSNQIKQLESQLHTELFERKSRRESVPTPAADILYKRSAKILDDWHDIHTEIVDLQASKKAHVRFGISQTISRILFAKIANQLNLTEPHINYDVTVSNSEGVLTQLEDYQIDLGIIEKPLVTEHVKRISIGKDQLVKAGTPTGTWITREAGSGIGYYTEQYFREADIQPIRLIHVNNSGLIRRIVSTGVGQALLSSRDVPENVQVETLGNTFIRDFYLLVRDEDLQVPLLTSVTELITQVSKKMTI
ncbi:LysR family transcriptional regulator [Lentilactobacillus kisonensis]|uniref:Transcriptional regulator, LysR family n=2 Tax=Lentilactobacillus kisonensis TaxID=481722 RepID=H1LFE3_9LACO|nr:LysR family transcriptional regulator [Lentilactobacillus kisonensis]EHO51768.1 transcriptional regulator, LysR family [Lentilactobacillus kisonensis F0435]KRL22079.1 transcriptional regulator, LysR family [Lentilactobacillus kisonensis DSM 19906 = JCM 15041]